MSKVHDDIASGRAHTNASLSAERAESDTDNALMATTARRALDDLVDRDRMLADVRLLKLRDETDDTLSRKRRQSPSPDNHLANERRSADAEKKVERDVSDAQLQSERQRSDTAVGIERREHDLHLTDLETCRKATDDQLASERQGTDVTVSALGETRNALALANTEQAHRDLVLGMVMHDLRSPLSVISLNAERIASMAHEASTRTSAEAIGRSAGRMERLIGDLLDFARIESGTLRIVRRPRDIGWLLSEVHESYGPMFAAREMTFTVDQPETKVVARLDYDRIVQVLSNLLGNAMKFVPRGGTVNLHVEQRDDQLEFAVSDNGPGILPAALPDVFERFCQIDSDARRGLGLGLYICASIVAGHGGRIWVDSEYGKGATFRFTLPLFQTALN